ncbi:hypothetical protein FOA52_001125 [Chlamydomonas sp. UWO 241]|nr:hypothetical protein FOA52_001125 [Chlamydomonas sp. UWO 241]
MPSLTPNKLRWFNGCVAFLQLFTGIAIFGITDKDSKLPWYVDWVGSFETDGDMFYTPVSKQVANIIVGYYSGIFLVLSGINHALCVLPGINGWYNAQLAVNCNPIRWFEYAISASMMHVMIAQLSGITEIHLLFAIFGLTATTMAHGWMFERANKSALPTYVFTSPHEVPQPVSEEEISVVDYNAGGKVETPGRPKVDWTPFVLGFIPHLFCWAVIACYFFQGVVTGDPPTFVWVIIFILFFIDLTFALNQMLQFMQVRGWNGFAGGEFWYIILSITAKQLLAWINYGGTIRFKNQA